MPVRYKLAELSPRRGFADRLCELQRKVDMMERLMGDCVIILARRDVDHTVMNYDEDDVGIGNNLLDLCFKVARDLKGKP